MLSCHSLSTLYILLRQVLSLVLDSSTKLDRLAPELQKIPLLLPPWCWYYKPLPSIFLYWIFFFIYITFHKFSPLQVSHSETPIPSLLPINSFLASKTQAPLPGTRGLWKNSEAPQSWARLSQLESWGHSIFLVSEIQNPAYNFL